MDEGCDHIAPPNSIRFQAAGLRLLFFITSLSLFFLSHLEKGVIVIENVSPSVDGVLFHFVTVHRELRAAVRANVLMRKLALHLTHQGKID
jgi:hypothetical protein